MNRNGLRIPVVLWSVVVWLGASSSGQGILRALDSKTAIDQYTHDVWQTENGLPQNTIRAIVQTRDGYLWLGTEEGLVRFDGIRFTTFDSSNTEGFTNSYVNAILEDRQGTLWIGTGGGGLVRMSEGRFSSLTTKDGLGNDIIRCLHEAQDGSVWIGTGGGGVCQWKEGKLTSFTTKDGLSNNTVYCIDEDAQGSLWMGTANGLNQFQNRRFRVLTTKEGLPNDTVRSIYRDRGGIVWIGTGGGGLVRWQAGTLTTYTTKQGLSSGLVLSIYEDHHGSLWVGTDSGGLNRLSDGHITSYTTRHGLSNDTVLCLYEDREGSLWIGTGNGGLNRLKNGGLITYTTEQGLPHDVVRSIYKAQDGSLWVGTYGGGVCQLKNGKITTYTTKQGLSSDIVLSVYGDTKGDIWIGTGGGGLNRFRDGRFEVYTTEQGLSHNIVRAIFEDREGRLWIGTYGGGLDQFKDGTFTAYTKSHERSSDFVLCIFEDHAGALWIGTYGGGMSRFENGQFTHYTTREGLSNNTVFSIYEDTDASLWIGTNGGGLNRFRDGHFTHYTTHDGLFNDVVYEIFEDQHGNYWMSCNKGIFRVKKKDLDDFARGTRRSITSIAYGVSDGMKSRECNGGTQPAGWKTEEGKLYFPTIRGVVIVDPDNIGTNRLPPPIAIEQILVEDTAYDPHTTFELPLDKERFEFHYTALSFLSPGKVLFKYKLEGFDQDWVEVGTRRVAYFTHLPPGDYQFRVIACNNDGVWNETGAAYAFYLKPHFYQTGVFYLLCILAIAFIGYGGYLFRVRQLKAREKMLVSQVESRTKDLVEATQNLEELNRRQADFVSGVSHELKTPLTLIRLYGETLLYGQDFSADERHHYYHIITRESERLTQLIEKVLDFSRIDRGQKQYNLQSGNLVPVIEQTVDVYGQYLKRQGFSIESNLMANLPLVRFDSDAVSEAVLNLMDNAAKYSGESRRIIVGLQAEYGQVIFQVQDFGRGIPPGEQEKIFEQFYRGRTSASEGGYGLGLFLVKHIMDAHQGRVELLSKIGQGSQFRLIFPALNGG